MQIRYRTEEGKQPREHEPPRRRRAGRRLPVVFVRRSAGFSPRDHSTSSAATRPCADYRIDVVDVPTIEMTLHCVYPAYMHREPRDLPVTGSVQVPQGTKITVQAKANKDLVEVPISSLVGEKTQPARTIKLAGPDRRHFSLRHRSPGRRPNAAVHARRCRWHPHERADPLDSECPARMSRRESACISAGSAPRSLPHARLPIEGEITDDYGVSKVWFEYKLDQGEPVQVPLRANPHDRTSLSFDRAADEALDFKEQPLKVGRQMSLAIMAQDNCTLKKGRTSRRASAIRLPIVAPEQLMSMLEARELTLRLRLEQIAQDITTARDQLGKLEFGSTDTPPNREKAAGEKRPTGATAADETVADAKPTEKPLGDEPEDARAAKRSQAQGAEPGETEGAAPAGD